MVGKLFLRVTEARQILGDMSNASFYEHVKKQDIKIVKDGRKSLVPIESLQSFAARLNGEGL